MTALRNPATIAASVLGTIILLPFVVVGALVVAKTDPLATFLIGTSDLTRCRATRTAT